MGARNTVVLMSGQLLTADFWAPQLSALSFDFDVRFADHSHDETVAGMAERWLAEAPNTFDIVAHAMGGFVAFEVLRRAPSRVRSLALISTLASADGPAQTARREGYIRMVEAGRFADVVEERIPILVHPAQREDERLLGVVRRMAADTGADRFLAQQRAIMGRIDSRPGAGCYPLPHPADSGEAGRHHHPGAAGGNALRASRRDPRGCGGLRPPRHVREATTAGRTLQSWLSRSS